MEESLDIAVVGSGISGLSAAWLLSRRHRVTLFERDDRAGGHSNTVDVPSPRGPLPVDTGFIVYNTGTYPNLGALFSHLGVATHPSSMSFAVSLSRGAYEYSGNGLRGLFGQPRNALMPSHLRMIADTMRFYREAPELLREAPQGGGPQSAGTAAGQTLGDYLKVNRYSDAFTSRHILPMAAAIWSTPAADVMDFPVTSFVRFFANHGLLQVQPSATWRTVVGGSRAYVTRMLAQISGPVELGVPVQRIERVEDGVIVTLPRGQQRFDACVIATHANQALEVLSDADATERRLLRPFRYSVNRAVLHSDPGFMPRRRRLWSSWNYLAQGQDPHAGLSVTYWMNSLQPLDPGAAGAAVPDLFVTLNPGRPIAAGCSIAAFDYQHPMIDAAAITAQRDLWALQGRRRTWFCGSYFGYGFHEDGLQAGLAVAEAIGGVRRPWTVADESQRIHLPRAIREIALPERELAL